MASMMQGFDPKGLEDLTKKLTEDLKEELQAM